MSVSETDLIATLRAGNEAAFSTLVASYHARMVRLACTFVGDIDVAEEVAQEAWLGVLRGLNRFEGRASFQTWLFTILTNCARTRAQRERRTIPFSAYFGEGDEAEPTVDAEQFHTEGPREGHWRHLPGDWRQVPETRFLAQETLAIVQHAIDQLPPNQRGVILLRDVEGMSSAEVCNILVISESNLRVLLHRARAKVQKALAAYFRED